MTPRYFTDGTLSSTQPWRQYLVCKGGLLTWDLEGLKLMSQNFSHFSRISRSFCRISELACLSRARYRAVSSADNRTLDLTCSGRSLT